MARIRTHNNRRRSRAARFMDNTTRQIFVDGAICIFCEKGKFRFVEQEEVIPIGEEGTPSYYEAKGLIPAFMCDTCDCGIHDFRSVEVKERLIEEQTPYRLSEDRMFWIFNPEAVSA